MAKLNVKTCDWQELREKMWNAIHHEVGHGGLAFHEQMLWKSYDSGRCVECGAPGTVKHGKSMLAQAIPHYFLCDDCDAYFEGSVGGFTYTVLSRNGEHWAKVESFTNRRTAQQAARRVDGETMVRTNAY